jgi:hypothetical protein
LGYCPSVSRMTSCLRQVPFFPVPVCMGRRDTILPDSCMMF